MENYTIINRDYVADEGYIFHSISSGFISKKLRLPSPEFFSEYEIVQYYQAPEGQIYERIADGEQISLLLIKETDSLLNYKLVPIKNETESI